VFEIHNDDGPIMVKGKALVYLDGKLAQEAAKKLKAETGVKHYPKPVGNSLWQIDAALKYALGDWKMFPWMMEKWFVGKEHHFLHRAVNGMAEFFATAEDGSRNKMTQMNVGRYLNEFYSDTLKDSEIKKYATLAAADEIELKFATTREEIYQVYYDGPNSCMSLNKSKSTFHDPRDPAKKKTISIARVEAYASGDFAVAYVRNKQGRVSARTVVIPDKKIYCMIYGEDIALSKLLKQAGYEQSTDHADYKGLKLLYLGHFVGYPESTCIAPHLDFSNKGLKRSECGKFSILL
jgi:hypothetical protein